MTNVTPYNNTHLLSHSSVDQKYWFDITGFSARGLPRAKSKCQLVVFSFWSLGFTSKCIQVIDRFFSSLGLQEYGPIVDSRHSLTYGSVNNMAPCFYNASR